MLRNDSRKILRLFFPVIKQLCFHEAETVYEKKTHCNSQQAIISGACSTRRASVYSEHRPRRAFCVSLLDFAFVFGRSVLRNLYMWVIPSLTNSTPRGGHKSQFKKLGCGLTSVSRQWGACQARKPMPALAQDPSTAFSLTQSERHRLQALLDTHTPQHLLSTAHCFHPVHLGLLDSPEM